MDRFTKNALILLVICTSIMCIAAYVGYASGAGMEGTDGLVEEHAASTGGLEAKGVLPSVEYFGDQGEYVGFTLAGIISGFLVGYYWTDIFGGKKNA